ncbi:lipid A biosynthesis acyltransferase [Arhodomonas sp. AD133]|uniref:lipid A biosynthesis acyltransferase n=1 Tax=Arhodomonas sp. AD133 TaxID=3415009 RepID=UPI003EBCA6B6
MRLNREDAPHWTVNPGRGSRWSITLIVRLALACGRTAIYPLVHVVTLYFVLVSARSRAVSRAYLARALDRAPTWRDVYRHHWRFACTLLDRVFLLAGRRRGIRVRPVCGDDALDLLGSRPCLLLGAHLGSFEVLRGLADTHPSLAVRPLMYREQHQHADRVLAAINPEQAARVIPIGGIDGLLAAGEAVAAGESLGMLGDRAPPGTRQHTCRLLDGEVALPEGPLRIAHALRLPVVLCFGLNRGWGRYDAHFEVLCHELRLPAGGKREAAVAGWLQTYADRLAAYCRTSPCNWFNFYDFWQELDHAPVAADGGDDLAVVGRRG